MIKIALNEEQIGLFKKNGTIVTDSQGNDYYYFPFWVSETDEKGVYELSHLNDVPQSLQDIIMLQRKIDNQ